MIRIQGGYDDPRPSSWRPTTGPNTRTPPISHHWQPAASGQPRPDPLLMRVVLPQMHLKALDRVLRTNGITLARTVCTLDPRQEYVFCRGQGHLFRGERQRHRVPCFGVDGKVPHCRVKDVVGVIAAKLIETGCEPRWWWWLRAGYEYLANTGSKWDKGSNLRLQSWVVCHPGSVVEPECHLAGSEH